MLTHSLVQFTTSCCCYVLSWISIDTSLQPGREIATEFFVVTERASARHNLPCIIFHNLFGQMFQWVRVSYFKTNFVLFLNLVSFFSIFSFFFLRNLALIFITIQLFLLFCFYLVIGISRLNFFNLRRIHFFFFFYKETSLVPNPGGTCIMSLLPK